MMLELTITKFKMGISLLCWNHFPNYSKNTEKLFRQEDWLREWSENCTGKFPFIQPLTYIHR